jgi:hypothetical protein
MDTGVTDRRRGRQQRNRVDGECLLIVIPAKAGTHRLNEDGYSPPLNTHIAMTGPMGPGFRRDDGLF